MAIAAGCLVLSYLSAFVNPAKAWFLTLPGLLFFPLALLNIFLFGWAVARRSKAFLIPLIALLPTFFFLGRYFRFAAGDNSMAGPDAVRIVSYNVGRFGMYAENSGAASRAACRDSVYSFIEKCDADIICLQEFSTKGNARKELSERFPGYDIEYYLFSGRFSDFGNVILSRLPIRDKGVVKFDGSTNLSVYADIFEAGRKIRIYNCHFESYNISFPGMVKSLREKRKDVLHETEEKMKRSLSLRPKQVDKVMRNIADSEYETVLCGDFNDNPMSYTYRKMRGNFDDAFCEKGRGVIATYRGLLGVFRIDYLFLSDDLVTLHYNAEQIRWSDHNPVVVDLKFR